jgi:hypothetical protein
MPAGRVGTQPIARAARIGRLGLIVALVVGAARAAQGESPPMRLGLPVPVPPALTEAVLAGPGGHGAAAEANRVPPSSAGPVEGAANAGLVVDSLGLRDGALPLPGTDGLARATAGATAAFRQDQPLGLRAFEEACTGNDVCGLAVLPGLVPTMPVLPGLRPAPSETPARNGAVVLGLSAVPEAERPPLTVKQMAIEVLSLLGLDHLVQTVRSAPIPFVLLILLLVGAVAGLLVRDGTSGRRGGTRHPLAEEPRAAGDRPAGDPDTVPRPGTRARPSPDVEEGFRP